MSGSATSGSTRFGLGHVGHARLSSEFEPGTDTVRHEGVTEMGRESVLGPPSRAVGRDDDLGMHRSEVGADLGDERLEVGTVEVKTTQHRVRRFQTGPL
jgi:hypothetical protein